MYIIICAIDLRCLFKLDPPPLNPMLLSKYDKSYTLESSYVLPLESAKRLKICKNWIFLQYCKNVSKKNVQKIIKYTFLKSPLICKNICKILNNQMSNQEKLKMCQFLLTGCMQIICKYLFAKLVQFVSLCQRLSKKLNVIKIWQMKVGQNKELVCYRKK